MQLVAAFDPDIGAGAASHSSPAAANPARPTAGSWRTGGQELSELEPIVGSPPNVAGGLPSAVVDQPMGVADPSPAVGSQRARSRLKQPVSGNSTVLRY